MTDALGPLRPSSIMTDAGDRSLPAHWSDQDTNTTEALTALQSYKKKDAEKGVYLSFRKDDTMKLIL